MPKKILLAEDHPVYREGIRQIIERDTDFQVVFETANGKDALDQARVLKPDLAMLDINLPGMGGLEIARSRLNESLEFEIIFLTMYREQEIFDEALELGVKGYVLKDSSPTEISQALLSVAAGDAWFSPSLASFALDQKTREQKLNGTISGMEQLTPTERRVLKMIASDRTTKEIAAQFGVSPRTIDNHRFNISGKLGLSGSHSLLKFAFENRSKL